MPDIHITNENRKTTGLDPMQRLEQAIRHAVSAHPDAACRGITGALPHHRIREQYQQLKTVLDAAPMPVHVTLGNHDNRENFLETFSDTPTDPNGFIQSAHIVGDHKLIILDSNDPTTTPYHGGNLCTDRLNWLERELEGQPEGSCIVMLHHPPFETGFPGMDGIGLLNRDALNQIIASHPAIAMTISGHVHRTIWGIAGGKPSAVLKSTCHQMPMELVDPDSSLSVDEPGAYGVLLLGNDGVVLISEDVGISKTATSDADSK